MCGRYRQVPLKQLYQDYGTFNLSKDVRDMIFVEDAFPGQQLLVGIKAGFVTMHWGLTVTFQKKEVIHARYETIHDKPLFNQLTNNRCIIPCRSFNEWDHQKQKYEVHTDNDVFYLAGVYRVYGGQRQFVLLTTASKDDYAHVHPRIPFLLNQQQAKQYLENSDGLDTLKSINAVILFKQV